MIVKDKEKPKGKKRRWVVWCLGIVGLLGLLALVAIIGIGVFLADLFQGTSPCDTVDLSQEGIELIGRDFEFPDDITNFGASCSGFFDNYTLYIEFDVDPQGFEDFQDSITPIEEWAEDPLLTDERVELIDSLVTRRDIERMESYIYGESEFRAYLVLADTSDPDIYKVYLRFSRQF
ncbi:MAG: hypothetical protein AAFV93_25425 [Chloroflexota bacterium]